ncbi:MAG TPA: hypothetical protein VFJ82_26040 [Longimicrobium sp.]|nr:hypothetical protein [Longimicrobium sp.]
MRVRTLSLTLLAAAALAACSPEQALTGPGRSPAAPDANHVGANCVNFGIPPLGSTFGPPTPPGTTVWVENGIPVSVNTFLQSTGAWSYGVLTTELAPASFTLAAGKTGHTNNINTGYDFTGLGFAVTFVKFHARQIGGYDNLSVNGSPIFVGPLPTHPAALGGVAIASAWVGIPGGVQGTVTLTGSAATPITKLLVGGQELWLDTICAYP